MRFTLLLASLTLCVSCAGTGPKAIAIERFRGVYSTHFDGIPDQAGICTEVTNRGTRPVRWIKLRLRAYSDRGRKSKRWTSFWVYDKPIAPGASVALEFLNPPNVPQVELRLIHAGNGRVPEGRPLRAVESCSETQLLRNLQQRYRTREAQGIQVLPIVRRNHPERTTASAHAANPMPAGFTPADGRPQQAARAHPTAARVPPGAGTTSR